MSLHIFNYAEIFALLVSLACIVWLYQTRYMYFVPYLLMTVCAEFAGRYLGQKHLYILNVRVYNITTVIEFLFFYYLFFRGIKNERFKKIILSLSVLYLLCAVVNTVFIQGFDQWSSYTMLIGTIIIIIFVFLFFYDAFDNNEPINLAKEPMFWISMGIFLFYLGDFTFNLMYPYLHRNNLHREQRLFQNINNNLIVFEYLCFSVALIICSRNHLASKQLLSL